MEHPPKLWKNLGNSSWPFQHENPKILLKNDGIQGECTTWNIQWSHHDAKLRMTSFYELLLITSWFAEFTYVLWAVIVCGECSLFSNIFFENIWKNVFYSVKYVFFSENSPLLQRQNNWKKFYLKNSL